MASIARSIRRRRAAFPVFGRPKTPPNFGTFIPKSVKGRPMGARCFDFENRVSDDRVVVHFRHPTKKRTAGRSCQATYRRKAA